MIKIDFANQFSIEEEISNIYEEHGEENHTKKEIKMAISNNDFSLINYMYGETNMDSVLKKLDQYKNSKIIEMPKNNFNFLLCEPITVKVEESKKNVKDYSEIEKILNQNKYNLVSIKDIEFFENYLPQVTAFNHLVGNYEPYINTLSDKKIGTTTYKEFIKKELDKELIGFEDYHKFFGKDHFSEIINHITEKNVLDKNSFTSFLDTEKIHIQLIEYQKRAKKPKKEIILGYFGYGNHYPFTKNIKCSNISEKRHNKIDNMSKINKQYYETQLKIPEHHKINQIIELIKTSSQTYEKYYKKQLSYEKRRNEYENSKKPIFCETFDKTMLINEKTRTKASALIAVDYFNLKKYEF